ncbi:MAG TPA: DUF6335 family protein [Vicinamibacterales bacterium]|jgi:hypothetical protein
MARKQRPRRGPAKRSGTSSAKARKRTAPKARPKGRKAAAAKRPAKAKRRTHARRSTQAKRATPAKPATQAKAAPRKKPAAVARQRPAPSSLERARRHLPEVENNVPTPPSSLDMDRTPSAARSGRQVSATQRSQHNETSPELTSGDVDANWEDAYSVGDEAPGGDNPTPDQDRVDDIGRALGVEYQDNEELKASEKITKRDKHRWELDPASSEDYQDRD